MNRVGTGSTPSRQFACKTIVLNGSRNTIFHNFEISNVPNGDVVHIVAGASNVWIDHLMSSNRKLGFISIGYDSTDVTISNFHLYNADYNVFLGAMESLQHCHERGIMSSNVH